MVGQSQVWTTKPSRSDEVLDTEEQKQLAAQVRAQFDSLAPKRPPKPNRSEPDGQHTPNPSDYDQDIPELDKLRSLQSLPQLVFSGDGKVVIVPDEFTETQYYKELGSIDKQHHTTGNGFISVGKDEIETKYEIQWEKSDGNDGDRPVYRSNPATNDWVPSVDNDQAYVSFKPNRSESS